MEIKYICPYWGSNNLPIDTFIKKAISDGFDGIEVNIPMDNDFIASVQTALKANSTIFIAQQYLPPAVETSEQYRSRLKAKLMRIAELDPIFINSHTGKDYFSFDENCVTIEDCMTISEKTGIDIFHETHRGRFAFHAKSILPYIQKYPDLNFTADFSHLCLVSESLLEDQENTMDEIIPRCKYIHARVGFDQAAQVNHPFAPEWKSTVSRFVGWWQKIIDLAKDSGQQTFYICPEFSPIPYLQHLPFTQQPVANQWDVNCEMMSYLKEALT